MIALVITITKGKLRVFSGICINLFSGWALSILVIHDVATLTRTIIAAILSLVLAIIAEEKIDSL